VWVEDGEGFAIFLFNSKAHGGVVCRIQGCLLPKFIGKTFYELIISSYDYFLIVLAWKLQTTFDF
jgi:hypothetical protein